MSVFLFVLEFNLVVLLFIKNGRLRESIVRSYVLLFLLIAASTEALSFFGAVTHRAIGLFWILLAVGSFGVLLILLQRGHHATLIHAGLRARVREMGPVAEFVLPVAIILFITLVVALVYPPNNWDSMTYHMARVPEWIQQGSIDFYPTSIDRQNYQPPLAEFAILHLQLLSQSDRFANLVQWFSFLVSIVLATLIAREFQLPARAQWFSAVVASTLPMAILQSSSTQNDVVTSAFCLGFAFYLLKFVRTGSLPDGIFCAISLGLALLTKGTAYLFCCAIGLTIGIPAVWYAPRRTKLEWIAKLAVVVLAAMALNMGHISRNYLYYGRASSNAASLTNDELTGAVLVSNLIRNAAVHIGTPFPAVNRFGYRVLRKLLGDELNNPKSTLATTTFGIPSFSLHEDYAGNPLHLALAGLALVLLPRKMKSNKRAVSVIAGSVLFGGVLFCMFLKWQPWSSRLHTPLFLLSAPLVAAVLADFRSVSKPLLISTAIALFAYSTPFLILNQTRPLAAPSVGSVFSDEGRLKSYFVNRPELLDDYRAAAKVIREEGTDVVGLCMGYDDYEYPLWVLLGRQAGRGIPRFRHVGVTDPTAGARNGNRPPPDLVLQTKRVDEEPIHGKGRKVADPCLRGEYESILDSTNLRLWKRNGP